MAKNKVLKKGLQIQYQVKVRLMQRMGESSWRTYG